MQGKNELLLNRATMYEALAEYFAARWKTAPSVIGIEQAGESFRVWITNADEEPPPKIGYGG